MLVVYFFEKERRKQKRPFLEVERDCARFVHLCARLPSSWRALVYFKSVALIVAVVVLVLVVIRFSVASRFFKCDGFSVSKQPSRNGPIRPCLVVHLGFFWTPLQPSFSLSVSHVLRSALDSFEVY